MTAILGISAYYHDSAAALVIDGKIVAAVQEERFSRQKHDSGFPLMSIEYCLNEAGLKPTELDYVAFYDKPFLKFERLLETYLAFAPAGVRSFFHSMPLWLRTKLHLPREIRRGLKGGYRKRIVFAEHHESHAASAFFPSPFQEAAILTIDGVGEWASATYGTGRGNKIELTHELRFPHSLGLLYSAFTYFTGFRVNSGEYKMMGLAPYGEPRYRELIEKHLLDLKPDGSFRLDLSYFNYCQGLTMTSPKFARLFGRGPRTPESEITQQDMDIAASVQAVTEEIVLRVAMHIHDKTGMGRLCLAGGVALNCVANGRLMREGPFDEIWIQPASGDSGGALGVALFTWHQLLDQPRTASESDDQQASLLGPVFSNEQIRPFLDQVGAVYEWVADENQLLATVAKLLAEQNVVGWFQGRMEFGPRALGCRSILADARGEDMQERINRRIKGRESFRPFAPAVLQERAHEFFDVGQDTPCPYMSIVAQVEGSRKTKLADTDTQTAGLDKRKIRRSQIPAVTHVDNSARIQTVDEERHGRFYKLIEKFDQLTACPLLINTSFNVRGEPIVCTPEEAYQCFVETDLDVLVLENFVLRKSEQTPTNVRSTAQNQPNATLNESRKGLS